MTQSQPSQTSADPDDFSVLEMLLPLVESWRLLCFVTLVAAICGLAATYVLPPTFTARTSFMPPQQQQSSLAATLSNIGALGGLAGSAVNLRTPADQYVALLESVYVADRMVDRFELMKVYEVSLRVDARRKLAERAQVTIGKKDGLISIEVEDHDPQRSAEMANQYVEELRSLTSRLSLTEAQQRAGFFERQLAAVRQRLTDAQLALQRSGLSSGALRAEPRMAADQYARARAEVTGAEVRLRALRSTLTDSAPEVQQQSALLAALRAQLTAIESSSVGNETEYISLYREYKYQESLFDLYARQFELAKADEAREGTHIQVIDAATPPERRSKPRRLTTVVGSSLGVFALFALYLIGRALLRRELQNPASASRWEALRLAPWRHSEQRPRA